MILRNFKKDWIKLSGGVEFFTSITVQRLR